jgi:hypothetical protein
LFRDSLVVQTPAGSFVTGLVNGDFTKQLSNGTTGNLSTTGITITEVSAANNPGIYDVLIPASILAADGNYTLKLYRTADPTYSWTQLYVATADGLPGSTGTLSFTATANDGRIEDSSGTPLEDATVYLSYTGFITSFTTNASGLWGPWKTDPSIGTVTLTVTKGGYSTEASSLSVGASSVTGPGVDITLTPVNTGASVAASELWAYARRMANNKPGALADARIMQLVNDALDKLAMDVGPNGNWYIRKGYLAVKEAYATGTIALTQDATTCALTGGTFPTWAGNGNLYINGQPLIGVASRTDGTNLVLASAWGGESGDYSYTLSLDNYALASNAFEFMGIMNGQTFPWMAGAVTIERLWEMQNQVINLSQRGAWCYAIANNRMWLYPYPSEDAQVAYVYRARPAPLDDSSDIADIDPTWISTLRKQINVQVAIAFGECVAGSLKECEDAYDKSLSSLVGNIKTPRGLGGLGRAMSKTDYWRTIMRSP